jgi:hypothetical protein
MTAFVRAIVTAAGRDFTWRISWLAKYLPTWEATLCVYVYADM